MKATIEAHRIDRKSSCTFYEGIIKFSSSHRLWENIQKEFLKLNPAPEEYILKNTEANMCLVRVYKTEISVEFLYANPTD